MEELENLGSKRKLRLLELYKTPEEIYKLTKEELLNINGIGEAIAKEIIISKNEKILNYHIKYMKEKNIKIININEREYPQALKKIYDPPISLYVKGNIEKLKELLDAENVRHMVKNQQNILLIIFQNKI